MDLQAEYTELVRYSKKIFQKDYCTNKGAETIKIFYNEDTTLSIVTLINGRVQEIKQFL